MKLRKTELFTQSPWVYLEHVGCPMQNADGLRHDTGTGNAGLEVESIILLTRSHLMFCLVCFYWILDLVSS